MTLALPVALAVLALTGPAGRVGDGDRRGLGETSLYEVTPTSAAIPAWSLVFCSPSRSSTLTLLFRPVHTPVP